MQRRLIIVSNRLPFQVKKKNNKFHVKPSTGGLVSAMNSIPKEGEVIWVGAADFKQELWEDFEASGTKLDYRIIPVFIDKKVESLYYNGFSNTVLWPLFHYFPSYAEYEESFFRAYQQVNQLFADTIRKIAREEDVIWVHDYQLMLLPGYLKKGNKKLSSSFFLHIPFPSYEIIKFIPEDWRNEILNSLLATDVAGFQTYEYSSHFKKALSYFLGIETVNNIVSAHGHVTLIKDYPISIDYRKFNDAFDDAAVMKARKAIRLKHDNVKIIFSIDRLDYSKGVMNRLQAYERLLENNSSLHGKILFVINVIPSRETIPKYIERKKLIEEHVSRINGVFGSIHWQPIIYQYQHLTFNELMACYTACDVALVTPLRDGMNLVAKEFVASRKDLRGVLILSEFAGAAQELSSAILVNPNDIQHMEQAMLKAITLDESGQQAAISAMQEVIMKNDVTNWAKNFLNDVEDAQLQIIDSRPSMLGYDDKQEIFNAYREARKRLILLDYDGTLIPFYLKPQEAVPGDVIKELVKKLAGSSRNDVVLISGRDAETLENWFKSSKIGIVAEHGAMYKRPDQQNWISKQQDGTDWKENVKECIDKYLNLIPGSFIEEKKYSIAWHYRAIENIDEESIRLALSKELMLLNTNDQFDILHGNKVIEIKSNLTNKGKFVSELLDKSKYDFVLAIGDDMTDEDMFKVLTAQGQFSIKVGMGATAAKFNMPGVNNVLAFLEQLSRCKDTVTV